MSRNCKCPHLDNVLQLSLSELCKLKQGLPCSQCDVTGPNLWICLHRGCLHIGCSEYFNDHSTLHFKSNQAHCIHMNQSSQRIWCYVCEVEVFLTNSGLRGDGAGDGHRYTNGTSGGISTTGNSIGNAFAGDDSFESSADDDFDAENQLMSGLVGLQNIANTCYMNAALQALSNTPALTGYFLECGDIIDGNNDVVTPNQRKTGLAKSYHRLVKDMWLSHKRTNGYVVPNGILNGIRNVHPMFRGYQQHDTQEFLRCFMDQLHEELKEVTPPPPDVYQMDNKSFNTNSFESPAMTDEDRSQCSTPSLSQSEAEYETCDSGVSEQSSLSDEITSINRNTMRPIPIPQQQQQQQQQQQHQLSASPQTLSFSRSPSPTSSQRNLKSTNPATISAAVRSNRSNSVTSLNSISAQSSTKQKDETTSSNSKLPHRSIISDVFDGKLLSSVQCLTCDRISTREETFQDLSLPIPGKDHLNVLHQSQGIMSPSLSTGGLNTMNSSDSNYQIIQDGWFWWFWNWFRSFFWGPAVTLHDCMSAFFSADELKGDNMYSCEKCKKLRNGIKFSRVLELPEMLCVHLKRFRHDLTYSSKISSPVNFPIVNLDMRPYLHKDCTSEVSTYDLTAVICHHGTVGGGHYTSFAKHDITGKWFEYDDQIVTEVSPDVVQNCEAYVLFYRKSNPQMSVVREQALTLDDMGAELASDIRFFVSRQWLNKFKTFAEPGPIDNWALLCPHGGLPPNKVPIAGQLVVPLPQPLWEFLYQKFGGGPACNHLFECDICRQAADALTRRQNYELNAFSAYKDETTSTIYAMSMAWFRQWQLFVGGLTDIEPGPINNKSIVKDTSDSLLGRGVKPGSDYAQINSTLWKFFYSIYGGGPEIILRGYPEESRTTTAPAIATTSTTVTVHAAANKDTDDRMDSGEESTSPMTVEPSCNVYRKTDSRLVVVTVNKEPPTVTGRAGGSENKEKGIATSIASVSPTPSQTTLSENGQTATTTSTTSSTAQPINRKVTKNVSFEGDENSTSDREISSGPSSITSSDVTITNLKRGKHHYTAISAQGNEIVNKKDKRHRGGIKTNGLFGAEGKYSGFKNIIDTPDDANCSPPSGCLTNSCSGTQSTSNTSINLSLAEASKKLDEITPLLKLQASISTTHQIPANSTNGNTTSSTSTMNVINNNSNNSGGSGGGKHTDSHYFRKSSSSSHHHGSTKTGYRKKTKSKSGRKAASYNLADSNLSDSDKN